MLTTNDSREALAYIEKNRDSTDNRDFSVGDATVDGDEAICHTTYTDPEEGVPSDEIVTYLVREDGAWKVDAARTVERMFAEALQGLGGVSDAVQNAPKEAAEQVGEAIAEEAMKGIGGTVMEEMIQGKAESSPLSHRDGQVSDFVGLAVDSQTERLVWIAPILLFVVVGAVYIVLYRALAADAS